LGIEFPEILRKKLHQNPFSITKSGCLQNNNKKTCSVTRKTSWYFCFLRAVILPLRKQTIKHRISGKIKRTVKNLNYIILKKPGAFPTKNTSP